MKKFLLTLALTVVCALGLTACGNASAEKTLSLSQAQAEEQVAGIAETLDMAVVTGQVEAYASQYDQAYGCGKDFIALCDIWASAVTEMGAYESVTPDSVVISGSDEDFTISAEIKGAKRDADIEIYFHDGFETIIPDIMVSPHYTLGEKMSKAGMNTLMGMGTVFVVLILIMVIISAFSLIPKIEKSIADSKAKKNSTVDTSAAVDNTIAQIIENEELSDDTELVAVIAAAIAASEGATSTDGVVIRSIRRASTNKWQRA